MKITVGTPFSIISHLSCIYHALTSTMTGIYGKVDFLIWYVYSYHIYKTGVRAQIVATYIFLTGGICFCCTHYHICHFLFHFHFHLLLYFYSCHFRFRFLLLFHFKFSVSSFIFNIIWVGIITKSLSYLSSLSSIRLHSSSSLSSEVSCVISVITVLLSSSCRCFFSRCFCCC